MAQLLSLFPLKSVICAPMVDHSELAFRMLCRKYGASLCYTPMLHAKIFLADRKYREEKFTTCAKDRPLVVQFCANDPDVLVKAAKMVENQCDAIDINFGCPQGIARRGNYGAFLLEQKELCGALVSSLRENISVPVTCKIRILPDLKKTLELCRYLEEKGCSLLTVHGRTKEEKKASKAPDWKAIAAIKRTLSIPVIANGGLSCLQDVYRCLEETGADGVMSSEAILENPAIFSSHAEEKTMPTQLQLAREYLDLASTYTTPYRFKRSHLFKFLQNYFNVHTEYRPILGKARTDEEFYRILDELERLHNEKETSPCENKSCLPIYANGAWYVRHRRAEFGIEVPKSKKRKHGESCSQTKKTKLAPQGK